MVVHKRLSEKGEWAVGDGTFVIVYEQKQKEMINFTLCQVINFQVDVWS